MFITAISVAIFTRLYDFSDRNIAIFTRLYDFSDRHVGFVGHESDYSKNGEPSEYTGAFPDNRDNDGVPVTIER
jgi:hypothetical protein